jgi:hypothetical protein
MKKIIYAIVICIGVVLSVNVFSQSVNMTIQPGCFYRLIDKGYSTADSLFYNADSSWRPTYYNGNRAICKGIWVARGTATGSVRVHPNYNTDTTVYFDIFVDSTLDAGYPLPFIFDKIFWVGTTIPMDSIGYFPDVGK